MFFARPPDLRDVPESRAVVPKVVHRFAGMSLRWCTTGAPTDPDPVLTALAQITAGLRQLTHAPVTDDAEVALARLRAHNQVAAVASAARLQTVANAKAIEAHRADGAPSLNEWLVNRDGQSRQDAARDTTTAQMLSDLPNTADALADGDISLEHAAVLARTARRARLSQDPTQVDGLVGLARRLGADDFRAEVRRRELAADAEQVRKDAARQHALRNASFTEQPDGMWRLHALGDQAGSEVIGTALSAFTRPDPADTPDHRVRQQLRSPRHRPRVPRVDHPATPGRGCP